MTHILQNELQNLSMEDRALLLNYYRVKVISDLAETLMRATSQTGSMTGLSLELKNAIDAGDTNKIEKLLRERGNYLLNKTRASYLNPLIYASFKSNRAMVKFLLEKNFVHVNDIYFYDTGIKPPPLSELEINVEEMHSQFLYWNRLTKEVDTPLMGKTALMVASDPEIIKLLLEYGADPTIKDVHGNTVFDYAILNKSLDALDTLITIIPPEKQVFKNSNIDSIFEQSNILMYATEKDYSDIVYWLLANKANVMIKNDQGDTVFDIAIKNRSFSSLKILISLVPKSEQKFKKQSFEFLTIDKKYPNINRNFFEIIMSEYNPYLFKWLYENSRNFRHFFHGALLIYKLTRGSHEEKTKIKMIIEYLLEKSYKFDEDTLIDLLFHFVKTNDTYFFNKLKNQGNIKKVVNKQSDEQAFDEATVYKKTLLILVSENNNYEIVKTLILLGAYRTINAQDVHKNTALIYASRNGNVEIVDLLLSYKADETIQNNSGSTAIMYAAQKGYIEIVSLLLIRNKDYLNVQDKRGLTVLMHALYNKHWDIAMLLLNTNTIDLSLKTYNKNTPLMIAVNGGPQELIEKLLEGSKINAQNIQGTSELMFAAKFGNTKAVEMLIKKNASLDLQNTDKMTALMFASERGHFDIVKILFENGATIDLKNANGKTALMLASENGHFLIVKLLLFGFADANIRDNDDNTALMLASKNGHIEIVRMLINTPTIDLDAKNLFGDTALSLAIKNKHSDIVDLFRGH